MEIFDPANSRIPFKVIGVVEADAGILHSPSDTLAHLKRAARSMGGDALTDLQRGPGAGMITPTGSSYVYQNTREIWSAKMIVWEAKDSQQRNAPYSEPDARRPNR
jgi:hypothetical protein